MPTTEYVPYGPGGKADSPEDRDFILNMIRTAKRAKHWPGMPVGHVPLFLSQSLQGLVADGIIQWIDVTKPSKIDPTRTMTYAYVEIV